MQIIAIYGDPRNGGFVHACLDIIVERLAELGACVERLALRDMGILDCVGCFTCLQTGQCPLPDTMNDVCRRLREADGLVAGCSVRNGSVTALYTRFWERISYPLGFTGDISDKHVLSVAAVGVMGGRKATRQMVRMTQHGSRLSDHLFFKVGIPTGLSADEVRGTLHRAADRLSNRIETDASPGLGWRLTRRVDRSLMRRLLFSRAPEFYAYPVERDRSGGGCSCPGDPGPDVVEFHLNPAGRRSG